MAHRTAKVQGQELQKHFKSHGLTPHRTEGEMIYRKGRPVGHALRLFFREDWEKALRLGGEVIKTLSGFGRVIHILNNDDQNEAIIEVSFKL